jgi:cytochrome c-type biogenesis protein
MDAIFTTLSQTIAGSPLAAMGAAAIWGVLSMLLSPCHLASIPLLIGFLNGQGAVTTRRAFAVSTVFSLGMLITIGVVGLVTAALGRMLGDVGRIGQYIVITVFLAVGLQLLGVIPSPFSKPDTGSMARKGLPAAFLLGLVFGIALGPCSFAYMAPMLAVTFKLASTHLPYGLLLLLVYGIAHCSVIVVAGTFSAGIQRYLAWTESCNGASRLRKACGVLVILAGLYMLYKV